MCRFLHRQDSLQLEAVGNGLMGEQTWPTEEELRMVGAEEEEEEGDRNAGRDRRVLKAEQLIPKGMSSYQADWFMDEEGQLDFSGKFTEVAKQSGEDVAGADEEGDGSSIGDEEFTVGGGTLSGKKSVAGSKFNSKGIPYTLKERQELDEAFPDEMDTPDDVSARVRFARYRALLSFRASPWHPKENLPLDYARIFQFENFGGTQRRLLAESKAVEQMQMHSALQARSAHKASGSGSVCGSVLSQDRMDDDESEGDESEGEDMELEGSGSVPAAVQAGTRARGQSVGSVGLLETGAGGIAVAEAEDFIQTGSSKQRLKTSSELRAESYLFHVSISFQVSTFAWSWKTCLCWWRSACRSTDSCCATLSSHTSTSCLFFTSPYRSTPVTRSRSNRRTSCCL